MFINQDSKNFDIVIRKGVYLDTSLLKQYLEKNCDKFAFIEHANDYNEQGEKESVHYHVVALMLSRKRKITMLNELCSLFDFLNADGIEIDKVNSLAGCIQYLTHQNYPYKTQHTKKEIITNYTEKELDYLLSIPSQLTFKYLLEVLTRSSNLADLINILSIQVYQRYRSTINDVVEVVGFGEIKVREYLLKSSIKYDINFSND